MRVCKYENGCNNVHRLCESLLPPLKGAVGLYSLKCVSVSVSLSLSPPPSLSPLTVCQSFTQRWSCLHYFNLFFCIHSGGAFALWVHVKHQRFINTLLHHRRNV